MRALLVTLGLAGCDPFAGAQVETAWLEIDQVRAKVEIYMVRKKVAPPDLAAVYGVEPVPVDPWGNPYRLVVPGPGGTAYDIVSLGRDGVEGGAGLDADLALSRMPADRDMPAGFTPVTSEVR